MSDSTSKYPREESWRHLLSQYEARTGTRLVRCDVSHVRVACTPKTGRPCRTAQVCSVDPQQFSQELSVSTILRCYQRSVGEVLDACF